MTADKKRTVRHHIQVCIFFKWWHECRLCSNGKNENHEENWAFTLYMIFETCWTHWLWAEIITTQSHLKHWFEFSKIIYNNIQGILLIWCLLVLQFRIKSYQNKCISRYKFLHFRNVILITFKNNLNHQRYLKYFFLFKLVYTLLKHKKHCLRESIKMPLTLIKEFSNKGRYKINI